MNDTPIPQGSLRPLDDRGCHTFRFEGHGGDYARLWLQCMALNILTIGFYVPWAKIRLQRYLYNHTYFAHGRFDYHASPAALLRGRLLVLAVLLFFSLWSTSLFSFEQMHYDDNYLLLLIALLLPWLTLQSARFRLANTSWNHLRLHFAANLANSYRIHLSAALPLLPFVLWQLVPLLGYWPALHSWQEENSNFTLGLSLALLLLPLPLVVDIRHHFFVNHQRIGDARLQREPCLLALYKASLKCLPGTLVTTLTLLIPISAFTAISETAYKSWPQLNIFIHQKTVLVILTTTILIAAFLCLIGYWRMMLARELQNHTRLHLADKVYRVGSWMQGTDIWWLHTRNLFLLFLTLGLAWPWVKIRTLRYRLQHIGLYDDSDLAWLYSDLQQQHSAQGDEIATVMGVELGW